MEYYVVDAFAEKVFEGNPAGVCVLDRWPDGETMQKIAMENNLSETAFIVKEGDGYGLKWFTPKAEIDLCGHATLAAAYVISNFVDKGAREMRFSTLSGVLKVTRRDDLYEMDFPSRVPERKGLTLEIADALGVTPAETHLSRDLFLVLESEEQVRNIAPDFSKLKDLSDGLGCIVSARGQSFDFVSRAFFPKLGVNEDPVCGSAHCNLIPFWSQRLGKSVMVARQLSQRGGTLYCELNGDRVKIAGKAVLYLKGKLFL